jgi:hypothetical protein
LVFGGVAGWLKSKKFIRLEVAGRASWAPRLGNPNTFSMNLSNEANEPCWVEIYPGLAYGEITSSGTRGPSSTPPTLGGGM